MAPSLVDISVLLIFFNRPDTFRQVFNAVREARPSRLFLYQDGARNENDISGIMACREIVSHIDWECEVHTNYQQKNVGCDPSGHNADKWAFSLTDKCIILEDDCVPSVSFFRFCKEMLDKYENDKRIWMISGFNHEEITTNINADYFFTEFMGIWGWATWRRVIDTWDSNYSFLEDRKNRDYIINRVKERNYKNNFIELCESHNDSGKPHFETILWSSMILNNGLAIMPKQNMVNNIGISADSTHFAVPPHMIPKGLRKIFTMPRYELNFPLQHPLVVTANKEHLNNVYRILAWNHPWIKIGRSFEELFINLKHGNFKNISKSLKTRLKIIFRKI